MKIKHIRKVKGLYEVIFDVETIKYHEEVIVKYRLLKENIEVSEDVFKLTLLDNRYFFARDRALKYLVNLKFVSQVREYLLKHEEYYIVNRVIDSLIDNKIIDDYITSTAYVSSKYNKGYGSITLSRKLNDLKVDKEIISKVILENKELEIEGIDKYTKKLFNTIKSLNNRDLKKKIESRLIGHGYLFEDINNILSNYNDEINEVIYNEDVFNKQFEKAVKKYLEEKDLYIRDKKIINFLLYRGFDIDLIKDKVEMWKKGE